MFLTKLFGKKYRIKISRMSPNRIFMFLINPPSGNVKGDLHGTTLMHATSLQQAYDMTWDHLHAYDIFTYKLKLNMQKFAPGFTGFTERKGSN